jgi:hypothetical protein
MGKKKKSHPNPFVKKRKEKSIRCSESDTLAALLGF